MHGEPRIYLPRTGQTTSYADGDDGYFQAGNPRATRFVDHGNGTVSDRATGLQWVKQPELIIPGAVVAAVPSNQVQSAKGNWADAHVYLEGDLVADTVDGKFYVCVYAHTSDGGSGTDTDAPNTGSAYWRQTIWTASAADLTTPATMAWDDGVAACLGARWASAGGSLDYAGHDDWRMPNLSELVLLHVYLQATYPTSDALFPNAYNMRYWASTPYRGSGSAQHYVSHYTVLTVNYNSATVAYYVRPVRGGRLNANW